MIRIAIPVVCLVGSALLGACGSEVTTGSGGSTSGSTTSTSTATSSGTTSSSSSGTSTSSTSSTSSGGGTCDASTCASPFVCCGDTCVNLTNDFKNCGKCGAACAGPDPFCDQGKCGTPPCASPATCGPAGSCCGTTCCKTGEICCWVEGGPALQYPVCTPPDATGTCPLGCPLCVCASPDTPIATPQGSRPIAELRPGDLVYSVDHDAVVAVPVARVNKAPVHDHRVVRVALASGAVLEISPRHPTADGRTFADLRVGALLDGERITSVELVPYAHPYTYDVLPLSDTGTYYAGGARIGSTLKP